MKGRDSGMPPKEAWEGFFNPNEALKVLGLDDTVKDVAEFGCGYGTFTIPAAKIIKGAVYAIDIEPEMLNATRKEAKKRGLLRKINTLLRDFLVEGTGLEDGCVDYVMLFNILHIEKPETLLKEAWRILKENGKIVIIHWNYDASTPRGPSMDIRPKPKQCIAWAKAAGFQNPKQFDLKPYHYGIVLEKDSQI